MKIGKYLAATGMITLLFGAIFHLQGLSIIGPETSFMYSNPQWITYGMQIGIIGSIILASGIIIRIKT